MNWKAIGKSVKGVSHTVSNKDCEDAIAYNIACNPDGEETMICCVSDGAGSTVYGGVAAAIVTSATVSLLEQKIVTGSPIDETDIYGIAEEMYNRLLLAAQAKGTSVDEFACTYLGAVVSEKCALFFQLGDGVIVRDDGSDFYTCLWWPQQGEYQNTTFFLSDDPNLPHLKVVQMEGRIDELCIMTDGLQLLALNTEDKSVHQPFCTSFFKTLRQVSHREQLSVLEKRLTEYLDSDVINARTDDDKTLFLATRIQHAV